MNKAIIYALVMFVLVILFTGATYFIKNSSFSWWSAQLTGIKTIESNQYQIDSSGFDIRAYSFVDYFGRECTTGFASKASIGLDCDYPQERLKK